MYKASILFISIILMISCRNEVKLKDSSTGDVDITETTDENNLTIYTIPTPIMVSNILNLYNIDFNSELLRNEHEIAHLSNYSKALNLGICLVDLSYSSAFNQPQISINYLNKIDKYLDELNIQNKETMFAIEKFRNNIANNDTIAKMIIDLQNKLNEYYGEEKNDEISLLIIAGIYIEGLHLCLDYYDDILKNKMYLKNNQIDGYKNLILQNDIYLDNIEELLSNYSNETNKALLEYFNRIKKQFKRLNISYTINENNSKIENIKFDDKEINKLIELISETRSYISSV